MTYAVLLSAETERNREYAYQYYLRRSPQGAYGWYAAYEEAIEKLVSDPLRFAVARESKNFLVRLQQINFGTQPSRPTHRMMYYVDDNAVFVVTLRHLMQQDWQPVG